MLKTPFYNCHIKSNAKIVNFCGYELPINYGSQIKEHEVVRQDVGMFDVSHMQIIDLSGAKTRDFLRILLSNDINKLDRHGIGKALYSAMLNENAGVIDDLIVYLLEDRYRIIANAGTRDKDLEWISKHAKEFDVTISVRNDLAILAIQGPNAISKIANANPDIAKQIQELKQFSSFSINDYTYARTGYTGENGLEVMLPKEDASIFWNKLLESGVAPCGLGSRDTLRLEAGMNLYGHDMNESITPLECGMDWVVDLTDHSRHFIGKQAYVALKDNNTSHIQIGIILEGKGILREGQLIFAGNRELGVVTSGTFSPTLKASIGFARVDKTLIEEPNSNTAKVDIRGNHESIKFVNLPFVKNGTILYSNRF